MMMVMAFVPFIVFAVLAQHLGVFSGLLAALVMSVYPLLRSWKASRQLLALEWTAFAVFALLTGWSLASGKTVSLFAVRLAGDAAFMLVALGSLLIHRPFTVQYQQPRPVGPLSPLGLHVHRRIACGWALAFAAMSVIDIVMLVNPGLPAGAGVGMTVIALVAAIKFTQWYPGYARR